MVNMHFQAIKISYLYGIITENYTVVNQDLLQPYDKNCRSYILFLSDVLRMRDVLGPQTTNRVVLIPRSTQWKLQEFLSSKQASDIINLLVVGESMTTDPTKVNFIRHTLIKMSDYRTFTHSQLNYILKQIFRKNHTFCTRINCTRMVWVQTRPSY